MHTNRQKLHRSKWMSHRLQQWREEAMCCFQHMVDDVVVVVVVVVDIDNALRRHFAASLLLF